MKPYEPVPYKGESMIDPFVPSASWWRPPAAPRRAATALIDEQKKRPPEPLEAFPLESIQMVGTLSQNKDTYALVKAGANLFRVKKGNYMGQNFGVITAIDEGQISLKEVVQDSTGDWVERISSLQLVEAKR